MIDLGVLRRVAHVLGCTEGQAATVLLGLALAVVLLIASLKGIA
ncbi:MAG TPA: hypothetical protein VNB24_01060 [Acidimicrobiales bacterium]|nr:hypothetical protein [Acidimicrobiales bacterium]